MECDKGSINAVRAENMNFEIKVSLASYGVQLLTICYDVTQQRSSLN